eukprot:TRINITY_DN61827_c0_g1_i1.p1 TRINITY_DN61827_c0_g1~~TRINITY_DN61827_c0_g1_i1.p1  ORF type:complete len:767 (-),score=177.52 TRINITY_DN61827_c0_g1_i1:166-2394(-)
MMSCLPAPPPAQPPPPRQCSPARYQGSPSLSGLQGSSCSNRPPGKIAAGCAAQEQAWTQESVSCEECGNVFMADAHFCRKCGSKRPAAASTQALDVGRLLAGLQRGVVPGADASVDFLCQKFSGLVERLQKAEVSEQDLGERCRELEVKLRHEEVEGEADRRQIEAAAAAAKEEARKLEAELSEVQGSETEWQQQLGSLRAEAEALGQRRKALDELRVGERARLAETHGRLRQSQLLRPKGGEDIRRLQGQLQSLNARCAATASELDGINERASKDEARLVKFRSELLAEEEARDQATAEATQHREELEQALGGLALLQEQLAEQQACIQLCEGDVLRYTERRQVVQSETLRRRTWLREAHQDLGAARDTEIGLERVQKDTLQTRTRLRLEEEESKQVDAATASKKVELRAVDEQLAKQTDRLQQVEQERDKVRSQAASAEEEEARLSAKVEQLRHQEAAGGGMRRNLESELQMLESEAEKLRRELSSLHAEKQEMHQRWQILTPALQEARRRVKELENNLEAAQEESTHEKGLGERLERETDVGQDKLRALRDENVRLAEQCSELEAQLLQPPPLRNYGFAAARRGASDERARSAGLPATRVLRAPRASSGTPRAGGLARMSSARSSPGRRRGAPSVPRTPRLAAMGSAAGASGVAPEGWSLDTPTGSDALLWSGPRGRAPPQPPPLPGVGRSWEGSAHEAGQAPARACLAATEPSAPTLQYLRNWIQSEEERLSNSSPCS